MPDRTDARQTLCVLIRPSIIHHPMIADYPMSTML
jgi:hypothetical protein